MKKKPAITSEEPQFLCRHTPSAWKPNTQVPTYYVASRGRKGFFNTINDAINFAEPYSRIEVTSGRYMENVIVNKPVEIGTNIDEESIAEIYSRSVTFTFLTPEAHLEGLRIHTASSTSSVSESKTAGVKIETGAPTIARCEIDSILVAGDARPTIEDCRIHHSKLHGLYLQDHAGGVYRANSIECHPGFGIFVTSVGAAKFSHNKVTLCEQGQVQICGSSAGIVNPTFIYNSIRDELTEKHETNPYSGISALARLKELPLKKTGDPVNLLPNVVPRSRIADLDVEDVERHEDTSATDVRAALVVRGAANPTITQNTIAGGICNGILICGGGTGEIFQNKVAGNKGYGICIEDEGSNPVVRENHLNDNIAGGIRVRNGGGGALRRNMLVDNRGPQILVMRPCDQLRVQRNEINSGSRVGILCRDRATALIELNVFRDCYIGVRVESHANPNVLRNAFQSCYIGAVCVRWGKGHFEENEFANNKQACVAVTTHANPSFFRCRMVASEHGAVIQRYGRGLFDGNHFKDNNGSQIMVKLGGNPTMVNNVIRDGREEGLVISDDGRGTYTTNFFEENCVAQVLVRDRGDPQFECNLVSRGNGDGLYLTRKPFGLYIGNVMENNHGAGIKVEGGGWPTIRANLLHGNRGPGLHIGEDGNGDFEKNDIAGNVAANVLITGTMITTAQEDAAGDAKPAAESAFEESLPSTPVLRRNWIRFATGIGITASSRGRCAVIENVIAHHGQAAIRVTAGSALLVAGNTISGGEGVVVADDGQCILIRNTFDGVTGAAVTLQTGAKPFVAWNSIVGCATGIVGEGGAGIVFENCVARCKVGFETKHFSRTVFGGNSISECDIGCSILTRSKGTVTSNVFRGNNTALLCDGELIATHIELNTFIRQKCVGIHLRSGAVTIANNIVIKNLTNILVDGYSAGAGIAKVMGNLVVGHIGIAASTRGKARFESNILSKCRIGVSAASHSTILMHQCAIISSDIGCMFLKEGHGDFEQCRIHGNRRNVVVTMHSAPTFLRSVIHGGMYFNVTYSGGACGTLSECVISESSVGGGVHIEGDANPSILRCHIVDHRRGHHKGSKSQRKSLQPAPPTTAQTRRQSVAVHLRLGLAAGEEDREITKDEAYADDELDNQTHRSNPAVDPERVHAAALECSAVSSGDDDADEDGANDRPPGRKESGGVKGSFSEPHDPKDRGIYRGHGVVVERNGAGKFSRCVLRGNHLAFVGRTGSRCLLEECTITENDTTGLLFEAASQGVVSRCDLSRNKLTQVIITGQGTSPVIDGTTVHDGIGHGLQVDLSASPTIRKCIVYGINGNGIACIGAAPIVSDTLIFDCVNGILARSAALGSFYGNRIARIKSCGVLLEGAGTNPTVRQTEICAVLGSGVVSTDSASGSVEECAIHSVQGDGVRLMADCDTRLIGNHVFRNSWGVTFGLGSRGTAQYNTIFDNVDGAIAVLTGSLPSVLQNIIYGGTVDAVCVTDASPQITGNRIMYVGGCGLTVAGAAASPVVMANDIHSCDQSGARFTNGAGGTFLNNSCMNHRAAGIVVEADARPLVKGNLLRQNSSAGIWCLSGASPSLEENICTLSPSGSGIVVELSARPELRRNLCCFNSIYGIHFRNGGNGTCVEALCTRNTRSNICIETKSTPTISECCIFDGDGSGILVRDGGHGTVNNCHITGALQAGIALEDGVAPLLEANTLRDLKGGIGVIDSGGARHDNAYIVMCAHGCEIRGGSSEYTNCEWRDCSVGLTANGGSAKVDSSSFWNCTKNAVVVAGEGGLLTLSRCKLFHCRDAILCEGPCEVRDCELTNHQNGIVVARGNASIVSNTIFDCAASGIHIRDGEPTVVANLVFDNYLACVLIDGGTPVVEENKLYYPRDGGTIVNKRPEQARVSKNLEHNKWTLPWEKNEVDRKRDYAILTKPDYEKHSQRFKRVMRMFEAVTGAVTAAARDHLAVMEAQVPEKGALNEPIDFAIVEAQSRAATAVPIRAFAEAEHVSPNPQPGDFKLRSIDDEGAGEEAAGRVPFRNFLFVPEGALRRDSEKMRSSLEASPFSTEDVSTAPPITGSCPALDEILLRLDAHLASGGIIRVSSQPVLTAQPPSTNSLLTAAGVPSGAAKGRLALPGAPESKANTARRKSVAQSRRPSARK